MAATGCKMEGTGQMEKVVVPGLGVAGFMTVTCPLFPGLVYTELHLGCNVL